MQVGAHSNRGSGGHARPCVAATAAPQDVLHARDPICSASGVAQPPQAPPGKQQQQLWAGYRRRAAGQGWVPLTLFRQLHQPVQAHRLAIQLHARRQLPAGRGVAGPRHQVGCVPGQRRRSRAQGEVRREGAFQTAAAPPAPEGGVAHAAIQVSRQLHLWQPAAEGQVLAAGCCIRKLAAAARRLLHARRGLRGGRAETMQALKAAGLAGARARPEDPEWPGCRQTGCGHGGSSQPSGSRRRRRPGATPGAAQPAWRPHSRLACSTGLCRRSPLRVRGAAAVKA